MLHCTAGCCDPPPPISHMHQRTFTTSYQGDLEVLASSSNGVDSSVEAAADGSSAPDSGSSSMAAGSSSGSGSGGSLQWRESSEQMNRALLTSRDPILLFDSLLLYESELEDNGVSHARQGLLLVLLALLALRINLPLPFPHAAAASRCASCRAAGLCCCASSCAWMAWQCACGRSATSAR